MADWLTLTVGEVTEGDQFYWILDRDSGESLDVVIRVTVDGALFYSHDFSFGSCSGDCESRHPAENGPVDCYGGTSVNGTGTFTMELTSRESLFVARPIPCV